MFDSYGNWHCCCHFQVNIQDDGDDHDEYDYYSIHDPNNNLLTDTNNCKSLVQSVGKSSAPCFKCYSVSVGANGCKSLLINECFLPMSAPHKWTTHMRSNINHTWRCRESSNTDTLNKMTKSRPTRPRAIKAIYMTYTLL